jgi:hypothetical protein
MSIYNARGTEHLELTLLSDSKPATSAGKSQNDSKLKQSSGNTRSAWHGCTCPELCAIH